MNAKRLTELLGECWHEWDFEVPAPRRVHCDNCNMFLGSSDTGVFLWTTENRTFDNANDIAFAIGKLKEMGLLEGFSGWMWMVWMDKNADYVYEWLSLSFTEQANLIEEFLETRQGG